MPENATYSDLKTQCKENSLATNYDELKALITRSLDIDVATLVFNKELLNKEGNNITVDQLNTMLKSL